MFLCEPLVVELLLNAHGVNRGFLRFAMSHFMSAARVFLDVEIQGEAAGRIVIELFSDVVPRTSENFRCLCTGEKGVGKLGRPLHYKGSPFHRVITGFMVAGGDVLRGNGTGGESIYGMYFDDENFERKHDAAGLLSMSNSGPNRNGSQFMITLAPCPWLDNKHVVFGRVVDGMDVVKALEEAGTQSGAMSKKCIIADCGQL